MEAIHIALQSHTIRDIITENVLEGVETVGATLKYFIRNVSSLERVSTRVELIVYQRHFDQYKDEMIKLGYQKLLKKVTFEDGFNSAIPVGFIPRCLSLNFGSTFDQSIEKGVIPEAVEELIFSENYSKKFEVGVIPNGVTSIRIGNLFVNGYEHPVEAGTFPSSLKKLYIKSIVGAAKGSLDMLEDLDVMTFGDYIPTVSKLRIVVPDNTTVNWVPTTVKELCLIAANYDSDDDLCPTIAPLHEGLESLRFQRNFREPFIHPLPSTLKVLDLRDTRINQQFSMNYLPEGLETLITSNSYKGPLLPGQLPKNLVTLKFGMDFANDGFPLAQGALPANLKSLKLGTDFDCELTAENLPRNLIELALDGGRRVLTPGILPDTITNLTVCASESIPAGAIPNSVKSLTFSRHHRADILAGSIPDSVEELYIEDGSVLSCSILPGTIPASVKKFIWNTRVYLSGCTADIPSGCHFECHLTTTGSYYSAPPADFITHITYLFDTPIPQGFFPKTLKNITLSHYHHPLPVGIFPEGLTKLDMRTYYKHPVAPGVIPSTVTTLAIPFNESYLNLGTKTMEIYITSANTGQVHPACENMFVDGSIPSSVKNLIIEGYPTSAASYSGPEKTIIYHMDYNQNKVDYFDVIGN
ncbi:hypothetical protein CYY_005140 [Polysphondylium violaceum]|uniref:FNIP repeat-containing protein n=1 Tax=Polysphondylium violaceum TaxID=133409 RepID=A0A8J4PTX8_9MYCE|nr:hypothetical protein CYY_005140 [Polysphondylium violaceum]